MSRGPDVTSLLERRLLLAAQVGGHGITIDAIESTPWASATFNGARHRVGPVSYTHLTLPTIYSV